MARLLDVYEDAKTNAVSSTEDILIYLLQERAGVASIAQEY